jgi:hypothetical protein
LLIQADGWAARRGASLGWSFSAYALPRLAAALVHADPQAQAGDDHHAVLASHR